jgi:hypothetical protein
MRKASTKAIDIPVLTERQLGKGVRGHYFQRAKEATNIVVLRPELHRVFPTSEAVNDALASYLAFANEAKKLLKPARESTRKKV